MPIPHTRYHFCKIRLNLIHDNYLLRTFLKRFPSATHISMDFTGPQFRFKYLRLCVLEHMSKVKSVVFTFKDFYELWPASLNDEVDGPIKGIDSVESLTIYFFGREAPLKATIAKILPYFQNISRLEAGEQVGRIIFETVFGNRGTYWNLNNEDESDFEKVVPTLDKLSHIHFNHLYPMQLEIITNRIRLTSLTGSLSMCSEQELGNCLHSMCHTLQNLVLECDSESFNFSCGVKMTALANLELTKFKLDLLSLANFPVLKQLKLKRVKMSYPEEFIVTEKNENFTTLVLEFCEIDASILELFGQMFPKLNRLELPFHNLEDNNIFEEICNRFKALSELHLTIGWNKNDDDKKEAILREFLGDFNNLKIWDGNENSDNEFRRVKIVDRESGVNFGWALTG